MRATTIITATLLALTATAAPAVTALVGGRLIDGNGGPPLANSVIDVWVNKLGVPPMEAIQAATYWPSKFMGVEKTSGTVVVGHFADIIAVRADVLENIAGLQNVSLVMKGGVVYKQGGQPVEAAL